MGVHRDVEAHAEDRGLRTAIELHQMYGGELALEYNDARHSYRVVKNGRRYKVPSVTAVTGIIDKSGPLMSWAINNTLEHIKNGLSSGGEYSDTYVEKLFEEARRASHRKKTDAASIGTQAHQALERFIRDPNCDWDSAAADPRVSRALEAGRAWIRSNEVEFLHNELPIYSRRHRYSGRLDGIARIAGELCLVDWKTSNAVYPEHRLQAAAYQAAFQEESGESLTKRYIIRLGKDSGEFDPHVYNNKDFKQDFGAFLGALKLYKKLRGIERDERKRNKS